MKRLLVLSAILLAGCVSMDRYKALKTKDDEDAAQSATLQKQLDDSNQSNRDLGQSQSALEDEKTALQADNGALLANDAERDKQYQDVVSELQGEVSDGKLKIIRYQNMLTLNVAEELLFDSGKAQIKPSGKRVLEHVGKILAKSDKMIVVVGNTDDQPLPVKAAYSTNWELSTARATRVVRFLQDVCKLDPTRLIAEGRAQYAPMASNNTRENRHKNRRIEISLVDKNMVEGMQVKDRKPESVSTTAELAH